MLSLSISPANTLLIIIFAILDPSIFPNSSSCFLAFSSAIVEVLLKPDLILLDLEMPEMSGLAFYTELQKIEDYRAIKIILTSENPLARDLAKALKLYGHAPKSAPIFELQQLMRSALA